MALSGSFTSDNGTTTNIKVNWSATQNIQQNTSTITMNVYLKYGVLNIGEGNYCRVYIKEYQSIGFGAIFSDTATIKSKLIGTFTKTVQHNPNGTFITRLSASAIAKNAMALAEVSEEIVLDTIQRNSIINSVNTLDISNLYSAITLNTTVYLKTGITHKINIKISGSTRATINITDTLAIGTYNKTVAIPEAQRTALLQYMSNMQSVNAIFELVTYERAVPFSNISSKTALITVCAANSYPILSDSECGVWDNNQVTTAITGNNTKIIQGQSIVSVICPTVTARNEATIASYTALMDGKSKSGTSNIQTVGVIPNNGNINASITVTDSRGYSATANKLVDVIRYENIKITDYTVRRKNEVESTIQLNFEGSVNPIFINDINKNAIQEIRYSYKKKTDSSYGAWYFISLSSENNYSFTFEDLTLVALDAEYSWDLQILISDKLSTDILNIDISQGTPLVSLRSKKVGINQNNPIRALDVVGDVGMNGFNVLGTYKTAAIDFNQLTEQCTFYFDRIASEATYGNHHAPPEPYDAYGIVLNMAGTKVVQLYYSFSGDFYKRLGTLSDEVWTFGNWVML